MQRQKIKIKKKKKEEEKRETKVLSPFAAKTFHITVTNSNSNINHSWQPYEKPITGKCIVCEDEYKVTQKNSRCKECGAICHAICVTFYREICTPNTVMKREGNSLPDLKELRNSLGEDEDQELEETKELETEVVSIPVTRTVNSSYSDEVETAMCAVEQMIATNQIQSPPVSSSNQITSSPTKPTNQNSSSILTTNQDSSSTNQNNSASASSFSNLTSNQISATTNQNHSASASNANSRNLNESVNKNAGNSWSYSSYFFVPTPEQLSEHERIIELLRGGITGLNRRISFCWPPVMDACFKNNYDEVEDAIENEELFERTENGSTTLMVAAACGHVRIVELLLANDPERKLFKLRNINGQSALDLALEMQRDDVIKALNDFGKRLSIPPIPVSSALSSLPNSSESPSSPQTSSTPSPTNKKNPLKPMLSEALTDAKEASAIAKISLSEVVKAISKLVQAAESNNKDRLIPCVTETVTAVRQVLDQTAEFRTAEVAQSNQVMIHLLGNLVKTVKSENDLNGVKPVAVLIVNELKNSMLAIQNT